MSATELATAYVSLVPSLKGANKAISDQLSPGAASAGNEAGEKVGSGMLSRIGRIVTGVAIGNLVSNAMSSLGGMFTGFIKEAASASDATDKFKATMNFAGLDTSAIDAATKATQKYADQTVYDLPTIQNTTAQLAANGVKNYEGLTEAAGNLNAVAGGNAETFKSVAMAITQTTGAGKLQTQNWMQLAEAVPGAAGKIQTAMKDAGAFTGNFNDAMANGQIMADEFNAAIEKLGMQDGAVQAAKSTTTFEGAIGNLQATIQGGLTRALNAAKPVITGAINLLTTGLGGAFTAIGSAAKNFSDGFKHGVDDIGANQSALAHWGAAAFGVVDKVHVGLMAMKAAFSGEGITSDGFVGVMERIGVAAKEVTGGIRAFGVAFKANDGDVTSSGFPGFMERLANIARPVFDAIVQAVRQLGPSFMAVIPQILSLVSAFSPLHLIFEALGPVLPQLVNMFGQLAGVALTGLAQVLPVVTGGIQAIITVVSNVVTWLVQFNGLVQAVALGIGLAVVGFKLYEGAVVAIQAVTKAWAVVQGILNVIMDANPISLIIIGIAALVAGIVLLVANWGTVVSFLSTVWGGFVNWIGDTLNSIGQWFASVWNGIVSFLGGVINAIVSPIVTGFNWIATVIRVAVQFYVTIIRTAFNSIVSFVTTVMNAIVQPIVAVWTWVSNLVRNILIAFWQTHGKQLTAIWNTVVSIFSAIGNFIAIIWNNIVGSITGAVMWVWNVIVSAWTAGHNFLMGILEAIWGFIVAVWNGIFGAVSVAVGAVWDVISTAWTAGHNFLMGILNAIWGFIAGVWNGIVGTISGAVGVVWGVISSVFGQVAGYLGGIWDNIVNGVSGMINTVVGFFGGMWDRITGFFSGAGTALYDVGKNMIQGLLDGAGSLLSNIGQFFLNMVPGWIVGPFKDALGIHSPSRVFRGFGQNLGQGLMLGTDDVKPDVAANVRNLVAIPDMSSHSASFSSAGIAPGVSGSRGGDTYQIMTHDPEGVAAAVTRRQQMARA